MTSGAGERCEESRNPTQGPAGGTQLTPPIHHKVLKSSQKLSGWQPYLCSKDGVPGTQWDQINAAVRDCWHRGECGAEGLKEWWCLTRAPDHPPGHTHMPWLQTMKCCMGPRLCDGRRPVPPPAPPHTPHCTRSMPAPVGFGPV